MAEIVSTGRGTVKPAGALTVEKTGQYSALTGLWVFNETAQNASANLANPGTGTATLQGAASIAADAVGSALSVGGSASQYAATGLTGAALGIGGNSARTIFGRVRPTTGIDAGGFFSYGTAAARRSFTIRNTGGGQANYQLDMGWADIYGNGSAPLNVLATFVATYDGTTVRFYINGVSMGSTAQALDTGTDALFDIGRYKFGADTAQNSFAWHGQVYEVGCVSGAAWSDAEVAAYDANPLGMLRTAEPTDHAVTAAAITTGAPVPGAPAVTQNHQLAGAGLTTGAPVPARPTVAQAHTVTAQAVTTGAPALGAPAVAQVHAVTAPTLQTGAPSLGGPPISSGGALTIASDAFTGNGVPFVTGRAADMGGAWNVRVANNPASVTLSNDQLTCFDALLATLDGLAPGTPDYDVSSDIVITNDAAPGVVGRCHATDPTFYYFRYLTEGYAAPNGVWQLYVFVAGAPALLGEAFEATTRGGTKRATLRMRGDTITGLVDGVSVISVTDATITQAGVAGVRHPGSPGQAIWDNFAVDTPASGALFTATEIGTGAPAPGRPVLAQLHQMAAAAIVAGVAVLGAPALTITNHALAAAPIETGAPALGAASLGGNDAVAAPTLLTGPAALGRPAVAQAHALQAVGVTAQAPAPGRPAVAQTYQMAAASRVTGAPVTGRPALAQLHTLGASNLLTGAPQLPAPGVAGAGAFLATTITTAAPTLGAAALTQNHVAAAAPIGALPPDLGRPALAQFHILAAADRVTGAPVTGRPSINFAEGLGGFMFVSLDEAKKHLRVDYDDDDSDISIKLLAAEEAVSDYIGRPIPWLDGNGVEVPAPAAIRAATLLYLGDLFSNRLGVTEARLTDNPTALRLLQRHRSFGEP